MDQSNPGPSSEHPRHPNPYAVEASGRGGGRIPAAFPTIKVIARPSLIGSLISGLVLLVVICGVFLFGLLIGVIGGMAGAGTSVHVTPEEIRAGSGGTIAILPVEGPIMDPSAKFARHAVDWILQEKDVRAVVLRVDSPGGGVTASDQIWYEVERLRKAGLPVIASYGSVAASGGYYVSCAADRILAEPTTITGSIGVIAQVFTMEDLMNKVGIQPVTIVATGSPSKDTANDIFRQWSEDDRSTLLEMLDAAYDIFQDRVTVGRQQVLTDPEAIARVTDGSVFTAAQAKDLGLVDAIGYLDDAIIEAEQAAGVVTGMTRVVRIDRLFSFQNLFMAEGVPAISTAHGFDSERVRSLVNDLTSPRLMYLFR